MTNSDLALPHAAGCVVYRYEDGEPLVLLIRDQYGRWTLPKGHLDPGETAEQAAVREVHEETGASGTLGPFVGEISYLVTSRKGNRYTKRVAFYLLRTTSAVVAPQAEEGITAAGWFAPDAALTRNGYEDIRLLLRSAIALIRAETQPID